MTTPIFNGQIIKGKLKISNAERFYAYLKQLDGEVDMIIRKKKKSRTLRQNNALHLWYEQLAEALNDAGYDMKKTLRKDVDIPWNSELVKEHLWRPIQYTFLKKQSTTELNTKDIDRVYEIVNRIIGERTGVHVPFPSVENLMEQDYEANSACTA